MFGPSGVLSMVLPFTQFYPGFTQLLRVQLGKTVLRFYPPTLSVMMKTLLTGCVCNDDTAVTRCVCNDDTAVTGCVCNDADTAGSVCGVGIDYRRNVTVTSVRRLLLVFPTPVQRRMTSSLTRGYSTRQGLVSCLYILSVITSRYNHSV